MKPHTDVEADSTDKVETNTFPQLKQRWIFDWWRMLYSRSYLDGTAFYLK